MKKPRHPFPDFGKIIDASRGDAPPHETLVLFFEKWWSMRELPALAEYRLLHIALTEILPRVAWPKEEFSFWVNRDDTAVITKYETFKRLYLDRFGPIFDAGVFIKQFEEGKAEDYMTLVAQEAKRGNPTGSNQHQKKEEELHNLCNSTQSGRAKKNRVHRNTQIKLDALVAHPELLEKVRSGEMKVHTAAKLAGIVKIKTPLDVAISAFKRLNDSDRQQFLEWITNV